MKHFLFILAVLSTLTTSNCRSNKKTDSISSESELDTALQNKALKIIKSFDTNSIKTFNNWNYAILDTNQQWIKISADTAFYYCSFYKYPDVSILQVFYNSNFTQDFPCSYSLNTKKFWRFSFFNRNDTIYRIGLLPKHSFTELVKDTLIPLNKLFTQRNPFSKLDSLNTFIDKFGISGIFCQKSIGNFVEFKISYDYTLTYLPDSLYLNPKSAKSWQEKFKKGTSLGKNWKLNKLYE